MYVRSWSIPRIAVANNDAISIKMPYMYVVERSFIEVVEDEDVDIDATETPKETKSTANCRMKGLKACSGGEE